MSLPSKLFAVTACLVLASISACASDPDPEPEGRPAGEVVVTSSAQSRADLGVVEWRIVPGDGTSDLFVTAMDSAGKPVAEVAVAVLSRGPEQGTLTYDIHGLETAHLTFQFNGKNVQTDIVDAVAKAPRLRTLLARMSEDIAQADALTSPGQSLKPMGGHTGGPLVRRGIPLSAEPKCLIDNSGNRCYGSLIQVSAGLIGTPICVLTAPVTLGLQMAGCAAAGVATVGAIVSMREAGCRARACK